MKSKANFHIHTVHSDGGKTVEDIVKGLKEQGITHFAITDHDTIDGVEEAMRLAQEYGMHCVSGVEISAVFLDEVDGLDSTCTAHILALDFDVDRMRQRLEKYKRARQESVAKLVDKLIEDGFAISKERNYNSRTTVAWELVKCGYVDNVGAAFENILNSEKYVGFTNVFECRISNVVRDIKCYCRGLCVLAHPFGYTRGGKKRLSEEQVEQYVKRYRHDIDGIEVYYQNYDSTQIAFLEGLADKYGLLKSIGTDYHHSPIDLVKYPKYAARLKKETLCFDVDGVTVDDTMIAVIDGRRDKHDRHFDLEKHRFNDTSCYVGAHLKGMELELCEIFTTSTEYGSDQSEATCTVKNIQLLKFFEKIGCKVSDDDETIYKALKAAYDDVNGYTSTIVKMFRYNGIKNFDYFVSRDED